ncbi:MAG TPA: calcium/sodium antiporter [Woeseiaceae bacterium]
MLGNILEVIGGLLLLVWGANRFVYGAASFSRNLGVTPLLIGLTVVAIATSAPEIFVSIVAASRGEPDLAVGNAIGSNIVNIGLVLGMVAFIHPVQLSSQALRREMPALLAVTLLGVSLFLDAFLTRIDGVILLAGLVFVMFWLIKLGLRSSADDTISLEYEAEIPRDVSMRRSITWLIVGLFALLIGAELMVKGAIDIARFLGMSEVVIGIVLVAFATSVPELAVSLVSAHKREYGLAIGNIVGSNIFNILAVIGVAASIAPGPLPPSVLSLHLFVMAAFTLVLFTMTYEYEGIGSITRLEGGALLAAYIAYDIYVIAQNI